MTEKSEMLALADELKACKAYPFFGIPGNAKFIADFAMTETHRDMIVDALTRAAAASAEPVAWQCTDQRHEFRYIKGIVTVNKDTVDAWRDGGLAFVGLAPIGGSNE